MLTDFGLSKEGIDGPEAARSFCGSIAYLAPEILKRSGHGKSVDWYLLGVLLYEMLVGQPPYFSNKKYVRRDHTECREELFQNITSGPLKLPVYISAQARSLILGVPAFSSHTVAAEPQPTQAAGGRSQGCMGNQVPPVLRGNLLGRRVAEKTETCAAGAQPALGGLEAQAGGESHH